MRREASKPKLSQKPSDSSAKPQRARDEGGFTKQAPTYTRSNVRHKACNDKLTKQFK